MILAWLVHFFRGQWSLICPFYRPLPCWFIGCEVEWDADTRGGDRINSKRGFCSRCGTAYYRS